MLQDVKINDLQLVQGCKKQNLEMQKALYYQIGPGIMSVCARYIKPIEGAEEVFHDVILKIYDKIDKYNGKGSLAAWCRRVAVNACLDYLRKNKNQIRLNYIEEQTIDVADDEDVELLEDSSLALIESQILTLPEQQQLVLNLFILDDYSHREIASQLNISEGASRSLLQRAKVNLKLKLKETKGESISNGIKNKI